MTAIAAGGLLVNLVCAWLLHGDHEHLLIGTDAPALDAPMLRTASTYVICFSYSASFDSMTFETPAARNMTARSPATTHRAM